MEKNIFSEKVDQLLLIFREKIADKGEDSYLLSLNEEAGIAGVFDGCGGSGARVYPEFGEHTGAYIASRVLAKETYAWFLEYCDTQAEQRNQAGQQLKKRIDQELTAYRKHSQAGSVLMGSMAKEFPSTLAVATVGSIKGHLYSDFFWSGDSRGYILDQDGLHQISQDDLHNPDAMVNLREDAGMTNVVSASHPYEIHRKTCWLKTPCLVLTATDGCFGYLKSPMEFEKLLLGTLEEAADFTQWKQLLDERLLKVSGDDYTMCGLLLGFGDFQEVQSVFLRRWQYMKQGYVITDGMTEEQIFGQWRQYKSNYETYEPRRG